MKYYSTKRPGSNAYGFIDAVIKGLPDDNGLFVPESIPELPENFFATLEGRSLPDIAYEVLMPFVKGDLSSEDLEKIVSDVFQFDIPLVGLSDQISTLELFHGPTLAFKDVGARFLARSLGHFSDKFDRKVNVLVATSGDTGSAVAHGFYNVPNVDVFILYPKGKVSPLQEKQLTTLGGNIHALEIDGVFDDCQQLVKTAFLDDELNNKVTLTSANSINIARWLPQSVYYHWGWAQAPRDMDIVFSVPSGNYGNLTAGLLAKKMGLPVHWFVAASNANDIIPEYLNTGKFEPRPSISTISNAMDVGNPSNFYRLTYLYDNSYTNMIRDIRGYAYSDQEPAECIQEVYAATGYLLDPHGAIGYLGLQTFELEDHEYGIFLETAHPAKFDQSLERIIGEKPHIPERLAERMEMEKVATPLPADYVSFRDWLMQHCLV